MYFALFRAPKPGRWIGEEPFIEDLEWRAGKKITVDVPNPLEYELKKTNPHSDDHAPYLPAYMNADAPLFRDDLVTALRECGVDNIEVYNVAIHDPDTGQSVANNKAVNIIGLVAAADMEKSEATVHGSGPALIDVDFESLVIDESKAQGLLMFRLAESTNGIIVHERLRDCLTRKGFGEDLAFYDPREVAL